MKTETAHDAWMAQAISLAERGRGLTSPNPMVGAVIVRDGTLVGSGFHPRAGDPHAEIYALAEAGEQAKGASLYCTLEPCHHQGRTGPCTEAIIKAGIAEVYVGSIDPNPIVSGAGVAKLRAAGIRVTTGVNDDACSALIKPWSHWIRTKRPFVTVKLAQSLDGRIAALGGQSQWISGPSARERVHALRAEVDAVMVGSGTLLADDPRLTARDLTQPIKQPLRVVVDSKLKTPPEARLLQHPGAVIATAIPPEDSRWTLLQRQGAELWHLPDDTGQVSLEGLMDRLGTRDVTSMLVEGGGVLVGALWRADLIHRLHLYIAPMLIGGDGIPAISSLGVLKPSEAPRLTLDAMRVCGEDIELVYHPEPQETKG